MVYGEKNIIRRDWYRRYYLDKVLAYPNNKYSEDAMMMSAEMAYSAKDYEKINDSISNEIKEKECNNIINHLKKDSYVVCLDLNGKEFSSPQFSEKLDKISMQNSKVTFIIGGSLGLTNKLLSLADEKICFSKMTFPHQLIRIFLLEQIFRAFKISNR